MKAMSLFFFLFLSLFLFLFVLLFLFLFLFLFLSLSLFLSVDYHELAPHPKHFGGSISRPAATPLPPLTSSSAATTIISDIAATLVPARIHISENGVIVGAKGLVSVLIAILIIGVAMKAVYIILPAGGLHGCLLLFR